MSTPVRGPRRGTGQIFRGPSVSGNPKGECTAHRSYDPSVEVHRTIDDLLQGDPRPHSVSPSHLNTGPSLVGRPDPLVAKEDGSRKVDG